MQDNLDKYYKLHHPEYLSEGMQVLREYIHFCQFDFIELCRRYDQLKDGTIPEKFFSEALLMEIKQTQFYFTEGNVHQILKEAPLAINKHIDYKELYNFLKNGPPPQNSFNIFRNAILRQKSLTMKLKERAYYEEIKRLFEEETSNFFDRKSRFDFQHLNLHMLDIELLASSSANIIFDDSLQEKLSQFTSLNNIIILENFQIIIAKKLSINALPQVAQQFIQPAKLEEALLEYFGARKNQKMFPVLMKDQFISTLKVKLYNQELTFDEFSLLYWLIWQEHHFGEFTMKTLAKWVVEKRDQKPKELIKLYDPKNPKSQVIKQPKIFRELTDVATKYSAAMLRQAMKPFADNGLINLDSLKIVLQSLEIGYTADDFAEFRLYTANRGLFTLSKTQQVLLKVEEFLKALSPEDNQEENIEANDTEKAYLTFYKSLMLSILEQLEEKAKQHVSADHMIEEIQLRKLITESYQIDQNSLTIIIFNLEHSIEPSAVKPIRSIYFPEFYDKMKSRFVDNLVLPKEPLLSYEKPQIHEKKELLFNYEEGQFIRDQEQAFVVQELNDQQVLEKFRTSMIKQFKVVAQSEFEKGEQATQKLLACLQEFDITKSGHCSKELLYDILHDNFQDMSRAELNWVVDFAMGVSQIDDFSFSYMYFCLQLNEYFQKKQLLKAMRS